MTRPTMDTLARWRPFVVVMAASGPDVWRLGNYNEFRVGEPPDVLEAWSLEAVTRNLVYNAAVWHYRSKEPRRPRVTADEVRAWIRQSRSLARRVPFKGVQDELERLANFMDATVAIPDRFLVKVPASMDSVSDANMRASCNLWALEQFRLTLEPLLGDSVSPRNWWTQVFAWLPNSVPTPNFITDTREAVKRVNRFAGNLRPGMASAAMARVLLEVMRAGHFGPDGQLRNAT